jgi:hypothetical protein
MQYGDVRAMLRLPILAATPEETIENACNFVAAAALSNLVSGISVVFYNRTGRLPQGSPQPRDRGQRFQGLLRAFSRVVVMAIDPDDAAPAGLVETMFRNLGLTLRTHFATLNRPISREPP